MDKIECYECYICSEKIKNPIKFCNCGKLVHLKCLHQWIKTNYNTTCEICNSEYIDITQYIKIKRHLKILDIILVCLLILGIISLLGNMINYIINNVTNENYRIFSIGISILIWLLLLFGIYKIYTLLPRKESITYSKDISDFNSDIDTVSICSSDVLINIST